MIIRRIALFFAILFGVATTQLPEFMQQYRQRLGGAIDEIAAIVSKFDEESAAKGLTESNAISRLEANVDPLAQERGAAMAELVARYTKLKEAAGAFDNPNTFVKWKTLVTTFDRRIASRAYEAYQPAVPTTQSGLVAGIIGFIIGGGLTHLFALPIKHGHKLFRRRGHKAPYPSRDGTAALYSDSRRDSGRY
jgi:hypothetical protein